MKSLIEYISKRDFSKTPEPKDQPRRKKTKERIFVIQLHRARKLHYDFRLEYDGVLLSWAVPKGPSLNPKDKRLAVRTENHPLSYAGFEGTIPEGSYGAGAVLIFDEGTWKEQASVQKSLQEGMLKFTLRGTRISGAFVLVRMQEDNWLLIKEKDSFAKKAPGIGRYKTSIRSGRTLDEIAGSSFRNPFHTPEVELAVLKTTIPEEKGWLYEIKFDGYRMIAQIEGNRIRFLSRNHSDYTEKFPEIRDALLRMADGRAMILDGEIAAFDPSGRSDFRMLQDFLKKRETQNVAYAVFDLLSFDGEDLRPKPLHIRKEQLQKLLSRETAPLFYSQHIEGNGAALLQKAEELSLEGIVGKKKDSPYTGKRSGNWIKLKCKKSDEFIIGGYIPSAKKDRKIQSLLLGEFIGDTLFYRGKVGSGIRSMEEQRLIAAFQKRKRKTSPFLNEHEKSAVYLRPDLIAEISYAEMTTDGKLRQASYKGLRQDKDLSEIRQSVSLPEITISHPNRIVFRKKKIAKIDIARYYQIVGDRMLPYLKDRPLAVLRCNAGIEKSFLKKHPSQKHPGIRTFPIKGKNGTSAAYFSVESADGILAEVQSGTVEFHIWGAHATSVEAPDYMVFDLDPDTGIPLSKVRSGAGHVKEILDEFNLTSFLKTSGGKGYHIVVPFAQAKDWDTFAQFAQNLARLLENRFPELFTTDIRLSRRKGKIFIDWLRNRRGATSVAPYSLRARESAAVSMPIAWEELDVIAPDAIGIQEALQRLNSDPWKDFFKAAAAQKLK